MFEEGTRGRVDQMLYNGEGRLTLLIAITVMYNNGVARTLGMLRTSKRDYCIKQ